MGELPRLREDVRQRDLAGARLEGVREPLPPAVADPLPHDHRAEDPLCIDEVRAFHDRRIDPEELHLEAVLHEEFSVLVLRERVTGTAAVLPPVVLVVGPEDELPIDPEVAGGPEDDRRGHAEVGGDEVEGVGMPHAPGRGLRVPADERDPSESADPRVRAGVHEPSLLLVHADYAVRAGRELPDDAARPGPDIDRGAVAIVLPMELLEEHLVQVVPLLDDPERGRPLRMASDLDQRAPERRAATFPSRLYVSRRLHAGAHRWNCPSIYFSSEGSGSSPWRASPRRSSTPPRTGPSRRSRAVPRTTWTRRSMRPAPPSTTPSGGGSTPPKPAAPP